MTFRPRNLEQLKEALEELKKDIRRRPFVIPYPPPIIMSLTQPPEDPREVRRQELLMLLKIAEAEKEKEVE